ncbi:putative methyltransferase (contains TPR repeat) [Cesiribacter andamanensis AMV16]|uniref:Putative methyltransferase (Contains TPR repeat) n=1 Tax=Cesiribacter andamanensis AMV16 TaxID=1279009 RepID=M7MZH6_9BACT|nr:putative methyltransferase (contains TPR repeat) [Cesiribacter andamanensis AMV16]
MLFSACSSGGSGFFNKGWHNTTAHYNAYFLAQQQLDAVEEQIRENHQRNFNQLLYVYPPLDTTEAKQYSEDLLSAMKMASLAIERHKESKWSDDSYLLIGKARYWGKEVEQAVETFKFVNTTSKDDPTRHQALIYLMRTFVDDQQLSNAKGVADFLRKENLNKENEQDFQLAQAHLYRARQEWEQMAAHLEKAVSGMRKRDGRAKYHFMLGQLYQGMEQPDKAYPHFRRVLRSNPDYELSFFARLHMAQVVNLARGEDEKQVRRYFSKLLKDRKNKEYRDKIYYELANFELRQGNLDAAFVNYKKSVAASLNNPRQKGYAYRRLAELYYDAGKYHLSKAYYDSTTSSFAQDEPDFEQLQQRQRIMEQLVAQLTTIQTQDSLLRLAAMDRPALEAYLDDVVQQEALALQQAQRRQATPLNQVNVRPGFNTTQDPFGTAQPAGGNSNAVWYFYNPSMLGIGQAEFVKDWGNRPLEDNWRRSKRGRDNTNTVTQSQAREEFERATVPGPGDSPADQQEVLAARRTQYIESLPLAPEQQQEAYQQIETAYYNLGKIFNFDLKEFSPTVETYTTLLDRFPETEHRPEVLYNLYLLYRSSDPARAKQYSDELVSRFPATTYARTILNPNYEQEEDQATTALKELYAQAYGLYKRSAFTRADSLLESALQQHPTNAFSDNLQLLRVLILGQTQGLAAYQQGLETFIARHEESELVPYARELLETSHTYSESSALRESIIFSEDAEQPHYFIVVHSPDKGGSNELLRRVESYNAQEEAARKLKTTNIILAKGRSMVFVSQFANKRAAMLYFRALERNGLLKSGFENANLEYFVISKDNFSILYNTRDVNAYKAFFQKFYY